MPHDLFSNCGCELCFPKAGSAKRVSPQPNSGSDGSQIEEDGEDNKTNKCRENQQQYNLAHPAPLGCESSLNGATACETRNPPGCTRPRSPPSRPGCRTSVYPAQSRDRAPCRHRRSRCTHTVP